MPSPEPIPHRRLVLYVAGWTPRAETMVASIRSVCEDEFPGRYLFEVVDVIEDPEKAEEAKIVATPTLILADDPPRRVIGDVTSIRSLRAAFGLAASE
ncbi:MAG: circadian clock KaiB family protein [Fimbriimonadaceae bacterium]